MRLWVLCGNDYPAAVYDSEAKAEDARAVLKAIPRTEGYGRIHWHIHDFEVNRHPSGMPEPTITPATPVTKAFVKKLFGGSHGG